LSRPPGALIYSTNGDDDWCCCWCGDWGVDAAIALHAHAPNPSLRALTTGTHTFWGLFGDEERVRSGEERVKKMGDEVGRRRGIFISHAQGLMY
jgi:hypothetical protein